MSSVKSDVRELVHKAAQHYRDRQTTADWKRQFDELRAAHGAMAANARFEDFLDAREQTGCMVREYFLFRFYEKSRAERDTYLTYDRRDRFIHDIHDDESCNATVPGNKVLFNMLFDKYLAREWLNPTSATPEEFVAFVKKHGRVMLKPACDGKGHGISIYEYTTDEDARALHDSLIGASMLAEELLIQHPQLDRINPHCINTVRVATYTDRDGRAHGAGNAALRPRRIHRRQFCRWRHPTWPWTCAPAGSAPTPRTSRCTIIPPHPLTGTKLNGFQLPNWDKALDVLHRASREMYALPGCRYLGWDIAFLKNEEISIVECNWRQGPEAQQPHPQGVYHELAALGQKL